MTATLALVVTVWCLLVLAPEATAQETGTGQGVTVESVRARIDALSADESLDAAVKQQALTAYNNAVKLLEAARASEVAAREHRQVVETAPKQAADLRQMLAGDADLGIAPLPLEDQDASRGGLEQALSSAQANAAELRSQNKELAETLRALETRPATANAELADTRQQLKALDDQAPQTGTVPAAVAEARAARQSAQRRSHSARIHLLEQELAAIPVRQDLLRAEVGVESRRLALVDVQVSELQQRLQRVLEREADAERSRAERATQELSNQHPFLAAQAQKNADLSRALTNLVEQLSRLAEERTAAAATRAQLTESETAAREAMSIGFGGKDFSAILRQIRDEIPAVPALEAGVIKLRKAILDARLARLRSREQLRALGDLSSASARLLATADSGAVALPADASTTLEGLLGKRRDLIQQTIQTYDRLITRLEELRAIQRELLDGARGLAASMQEELLWLPSAPPLGSARGEDLRLGLAWLADPPGGWGSVLSHGLKRCVETLPLTAFVLLVVVALGLARRRLLRELRAIAERLGRVGSDAHDLTPRAIGISLLLAAPVALLPIYLGVLLGSGPAEASFTQGVGKALVGVGAMLAILCSFAVMCRDDGVFGAHFGWSDRARRVLGQNLRWLIVALVPVAIVVIMTDASGIEANRNGLGRLGFIGASVALCLFAYRVLHPRHGAFSEMLPRHGVLWRSRLAWFPPAFLAWVALGCLAAYGYYDTAALIQQRLFSTGSVLLLGLIGYSVVMRTVVVTHRRMALQRARETRDLARAARIQKDAAEAAGEAVPELEIPKIDLSSVSHQTRAVIRAVVGVTVVVVLWMVWSQVFPALAVLDDLTAWHRQVATDTGTELIPVTWADVLGALLVVAATVLAYRNLPGFFETTLFRRGRVDRGTRFAINTISRYLIAAIGVLVALDRFGWDWSRAQWIIAAMGVGLGFGLQEIVANFVSGLIILFERPVRVGDTVSVDDLSGTVSRMQIRATTITDWDNREIIVPNKDLITGRVVNWTLSTSVTRLVLKVGVAYSTDTVRAQQVMLETAQGIEQVLKTPTPTVFFLGFGDSSLEFEVRAFVGDLAHRLPVMHELHTRIHRALADVGIEIPFPQRDLHMRTEPPEGTPGAQPAAV